MDYNFITQKYFCYFSPKAINFFFFVEQMFFSTFVQHYLKKGNKMNNKTYLFRCIGKRNNHQTKNPVQAPDNHGKLYQKDTDMRRAAFPLHLERIRSWTAWRIVYITIPCMFSVEGMKKKVKKKYKLKLQLYLSNQQKL